MYCDNEMCANEALNGSWLCRKCFHDRFESKDQEYMLSNCLLREIVDFLPPEETKVHVERMTSLDEFYFAYQHISNNIADHAQLFHLALKHGTNPEMLRFLATRYGRSKDFWSQIKCQTAIEKLLYFGKTDIVELFDPTFLKSIPQTAWLDIVRRAKTDESVWWLFHWTLLDFSINDCTKRDVNNLFSSCCLWKSERICERLITCKHLVDTDLLVYMETIIRANMSFRLFKLFWNQQQDVAKAIFDRIHLNVLMSALGTDNLDVLDFLASLPRRCDGFFERWVVCFLDRRALRPWIKKFCLFDRRFLAHDKFYYLSDSGILKLIMHVLNAQPESQCVTTIADARLMEKLVKNHKFDILDHILKVYVIQTCGDQPTCCAILAMLCKEQNSQLAVKYWKYWAKNLLIPCVQNTCLCTWLRNACLVGNWNLIPWLLNTFHADANRKHICDDQHDFATTSHFLNLVNKCDYELASRLFRAAITFGMLRKFRRDFLVEQSLDVILWFSDLYDCNNERMRIRDVRVHKNLLLRRAHRHKDHTVIKWLWSFKDNFGCSLKPGDLRDLRRG